MHFSLTVLQALEDGLKKADADPSVKAVMICGENGKFSAGKTSFFNQSEKESKYSLPTTSDDSLPYNTIDKMATRQWIFFRLCCPMIDMGHMRDWTGQVGVTDLLQL